MMEFNVRTKRLDAHVTMDTGMQGRSDAFNPAELLLAALSACIIKQKIHNDFIRG